MNNHLWSPSTGHFYHAEIHADTVPGDAQPITDRRHRELLEGQGQGRKIRAGKSGKPELTPATRATRELLLKRAIFDIKAEARRRILATASLERQANDAASIAIEAYCGAGTDLEGALERRAKIDAIRTASNLVEATIADWASAALTAFDAGAATWWPEWSDR
jgi:hypothetical protein